MHGRIITFNNCLYANMQQRASAHRSRVSAQSISTTYLYCNSPWTQHRVPGPNHLKLYLSLVQLVELQRPLRFVVLDCSFNATKSSQKQIPPGTIFDL